jgi:hypothetical protein
MIIHAALRNGIFIFVEGDQKNVSIPGGNRSGAINQHACVRPPNSGEFFKSTPDTPGLRLHPNALAKKELSQRDDPLMICT